MPRAVDPGDTDLDHPARFLLREALRDMTEAKDILNRQDERALAQAANRLSHADFNIQAVLRHTDIVKYPKSPRT